jgi:flagellar hook-length control protein FliK
VPESNAAVAGDAAAHAAAAAGSPARRPETIETREFAPSLPDATDPGIALRGVTPAAGAQSVGDRPAASAPRLETVEVGQRADADADVATQIVRSIRTSLKDGIGEARVRLRPDYLGEVRIELKVEGDRVSAVLQVERADVRQQVEQGSQSLRSTLAAQGLHLEELTVREDGSRQDRRDGERREGSRRQARRPSSGEVFELPE